jgi:hypothetical protein
VSYRTYEVTFTGQAGSTARAEFEDCEIIVGPQTTTLRADLPDQAALAGLIERVLALHCELLRVTLLTPGPQSQPRPEDGRHAARTRLAGEPGPEFVLDTVNRLFSVGLSLTNAQGLVGPGAAADRLAAAIGELDDTIRDIRTAAFGYVAGRKPEDQLLGTR